MIKPAIKAEASPANLLPANEPQIAAFEKAAEKSCAEIPEKGCGSGH